MHKENLEQLTARAAKLAASARTLKRQSNVSTPFSLAFLTDHNRAPEPWLIACALPRGAAVILRDYEHADRPGLAARLKSTCAANGVLLLIGADAALAEDVAADGVHFPAWHAGPVDVFPSAIRTASCHSAADLKRAGLSGIDVALLSPAFKTASHPDGAALGAKMFRSLAAASPAPVLALGGVTEKMRNISQALMSLASPPSAHFCNEAYSAVSKTIQTPRVFPAGSRKWNRFPPGKSWRSVISPPAAMTFFSLASNSSA